MAQNGMLDRDTLVKECSSAIDRYQEVLSTIKAKEKDIDCFTTDKTIESKSFDNLKAVMSDYILVIGAMGTAVNLDLNDCQMLKKTITNVDTNKIDVGNLQNQVATAETTIETNKSRLENIQKNLNSCANDNSEAAAQRSTQLRNDIRNYGYNIKNYNEIVNICNHYIQEYQDIEKNTSNFFTQGKTYRDKANGLLDEIMGSFTNGQYTPKQVSTYRNDLAGDESVKATLSIAYESNIEKMGISKTRIKKLKEYGLSMREIYFVYQNPKTSKKILYIIKGDKESLKKLFLEVPDSVDANTKAFLATYVNVLYHKDKKAFCELQNVKNTSIYIKVIGNVNGNTKEQKEHNITMEAKARNANLRRYYEVIKKGDYKQAAKILEENKEAFGSYRTQWDNVILSGELALAKAYSNQTVKCYEASKNPNNKYQKEDMEHAKKMYYSYKEMMETVSAVSAVKDLNAKNGMVILDKPVKDKENNTEGFEIRKYNLSDLQFSEKEYKTVLNINVAQFQKMSGTDSYKKISDIQEEDNERIRQDKQQLAKTVFFSGLQIIPGADPLYDILYSADQIGLTNYNCISGQDKVPKNCQVGMHSILNAGTALAQANQLNEDYIKMEKDYDESVDKEYAKKFSEYCYYENGTDKAGKHVNSEIVYSYYTEAGFSPEARIALNKWKQKGLESLVDIEYRKDKPIYVNGKVQTIECDPKKEREMFIKELKEQNLYDFFMGKSIECHSTSAKRRFIDDSKRFEEYVKKRKHIKTDLVLDTVISDTELCVEGELNY